MVEKSRHGEFAAITFKKINWRQKKIVPITRKPRTMNACHHLALPLLTQFIGNGATHGGWALPPQSR